MNHKSARILKRALSALVLASSPVIRHPSFAQPALVTEAREAIALEVPEVAIEKLRQALAKLPIGTQ